jgi:LPS export ABC transporter protein LptC
MNILRNKSASCVALMVALGTAACQKGPAGPAGQDLPKLAADRVMYGVEFFSGNADGVKRARMSADTAYVFTKADSPSLSLRVLHIDMFEDDGSKSATITAKSGSINQLTKAMVARGKVVIVTRREGKTIATEELHYDPNSHRVWSDVFTRITNRDGTQQTMQGFSTDDKFSSLNARGARGATGIKF